MTDGALDQMLCAIEQPHDVEIGDITIRPTVQG
jgi:NADP-dependent 3-hydroxy acid dehydrogenase YdfG